MTTKLQEIISYKKEEYLFEKSKTSEFEMNSKIDSQIKPKNFIDTLIKNNKKQFGLIAEIKKASPSKGLIRKNFDPVYLAECYKEGHASCLSVLTDAKYFQGHNSFIGLIKEKVDLPILRKDFIIDPWQIKQSRALGADCILLIMAALTIDEALLLEKEAHNLGMDVLVETHTHEEIIMANKLKTRLIGINNRNLKTMEVDIKNSLKLNKYISPEKIIVAESGLKTHEDLALLNENGIKNFLIGSSIFIKNDTLFRHGGYGYWSSSNFFIYLDNTTKEWEIYNISNTSSKARAVHSHISIDTGDEFYFFGGYSLFYNGGRDSFSNKQVWSFNFQTKNWHFLGKSKTDFGLDPADFIIDKSIYIINALGRLYRLDVVENELTEFKINPFIYLFKTILTLLSLIHLIVLIWIYLLYLLVGLL